MKNLKQKYGFTIIELLVVISIMGVMASIVLVNWNSQRGNRSIKIALNETITNLRKAQSYAVSSKNIAPNVPASFYTIRFELGQSTYSINALGAAREYQYYPNIETINLPEGVVVSNIIVVDSANNNPGGAEEPMGTGFGEGSVFIVEDDGGKNSDKSLSCAQVAISVVYGKTYLDTSGNCDQDFAGKAANPPLLATLETGTLQITLTHQSSNLSKIILYNAKTGTIEEYFSSQANSDDPGEKK